MDKNYEASDNESNAYVRDSRNKTRQDMKCVSSELTSSRNANLIYKNKTEQKSNIDAAETPVDDYQTFRSQY